MEKKHSNKCKIILNSRVVISIFNTMRTRACIVCTYKACGNLLLRMGVILQQHAFLFTTNSNTQMVLKLYIARFSVIILATCSVLTLNCNLKTEVMGQLYNFQILTCCQ